MSDVISLREKGAQAELLAHRYRRFEGDDEDKPTITLTIVLLNRNAWQEGYR